MIFNMNHQKKKEDKSRRLHKNRYFKEQIRWVPLLIPENSKSQFYITQFHLLGAFIFLFFQSTKSETCHSNIYIYIYIG